MNSRDDERASPGDAFLADLYARAEQEIVPAHPDYDPHEGLERFLSQVDAPDAAGTPAGKPAGNANPAPRGPGMVVDWPREPGGAGASGPDGSRPFAQYAGEYNAGKSRSRFMTRLASRTYPEETPGRKRRPVSGPSIKGRVRVICPYCDSEIFLGDSPIVAANRAQDGGQFGAGLSDHASNDPWTPAGGPPAGRYPVLWQPPPDEPDAAPYRTWWQQLWDKLIGSQQEEPDQPEVIRPVSSFGFLRGDLPARACTRCGHPLPDDIAERPVRKIGIVGTTGAGKSLLLRAILTEAAEQQKLAAWGVRDFEVDEDAAARLRDRYQSVHGVEPTNPADAPEANFRPFIARATLGTQKVQLFFYDIDGEMLLDRSLRARHAPFLHRPHGLIFLIDPMMIAPVRALLPDNPNYQRVIRQTTLVNACVADLEERAATTPIAITLSKSDLVEDAQVEGYQFLFRQRPDDGDTPQHRAAEMAEINGEVRSVLNSVGMHDLTALVSRLGPEAQVTFHAVAAVGYTPQIADGVPDVPDTKSLRCLEPLIAVLSPWVREQIKSAER
jgi:hypothetical protein